MTDHPITPPPELVAQWSWAALDEDWGGGYDLEMIATQAARWGADQELEACIKWLYVNGWGLPIKGLRAARRPKPPSLKEKALEALGQIPTGTYMVIDPESGVLSAKPWSNSMTDTNNNNKHPITPPPELVRQWDEEGTKMLRPEYQMHLTTQAARWGADQELEACCEWLRESLATPSLVECFLANRRPKPPSLKEQALAELEEIMDELHEATDSGFTASAIRRALEQLDD